MNLSVNLRKHSYLPYIYLKELSSQGETFCFSSKSPHPKMDIYIREVLGKSYDYEIEFMINPVSDAYEVSGSIKTSLSLDCVVCLRQFQQPINKQIFEIWSESETGEVSTRHSYTPFELENEDRSPFFLPLKGSKFHLGEWLMELLRACEPAYPKPPDCDESCIYRQDFMDFQSK